jgi:Fic family protein
MDNPDDGSLQPDTYQIDSQYEGFPPFSDWAGCSVDVERWERFCSRLRQYRQSSPDLFRKALTIVSRMTAVDTGAIENLYETDRGFTITVAREVASWEMLAEQRGPDVLSLLDSQFKAYDYVLDLATTKTPLSETWIRELHAVMCAGQDRYKVVTSIGVQNHVLRKGEYKSNPNHVRQKDGQVHAYAPVDLTADEMHRLMLEIRSEAFQKAHPALQAAYAHYAFIAIHPFADGNGRVARALASVFTLRAESIPILVLFGTREEYYAALQAADQKNYQPFVDFMFERSLEGVQLASESFKAADLPTVESSVKNIRRFYTTQGGFTHEQVDSAGLTFLDLFFRELENQINQVLDENISGSVSKVSVGGNTTDAIHKFLEVGNNALQFSLQSRPPKVISETIIYVIQIPIDANTEDTIRLLNLIDPEDCYECQINELIPTWKMSLQMRISIMVQGLISKMLGNLEQKMWDLP